MAGRDLTPEHPLLVRVSWGLLLAATFGVVVPLSAPNPFTVAGYAVAVAGFLACLGRWIVLRRAADREDRADQDVAGYEPGRRTER